MARASDLRAALAAASMLLPWGAASALEGGDVTVTPGRVSASSAGTSALFTVVNKSEKPVRLVELSCALIDAQGAPLDEVAAYVENVLAGETAYKRVLFSSTSGGKLACRIVSQK